MPRYRPSDQVIFRSVGDDLVLLDFSRGLYYALDPVGARIWELLHEERTVEEIVAAIVSEYEVDAATAEGDVRRLIEELAERELVSVV
jgi:hypothetical protein